MSSIQNASNIIQEDIRRNEALKAEKIRLYGAPRVDFRTQEHLDCEAAGVPIVDIPQSTIFKLTNFHHVEANEQQDLLIHQLSNQAKLDDLEGKLRLLTQQVEEQHILVRENLIRISKLHVDYIRAITNESLVTSGLIITLPVIVLSDHTMRILSGDEIDMLTNINRTFQSASLNDDKNPEDYKRAIEASRQAINIASLKIDNINTERIDVQTKLNLETLAAIKEMQANPPRILTGDEIVANFMFDNI